MQVGLEGVNESNISAVFTIQLAAMQAPWGIGITV